MNRLSLDFTHALPPPLADQEMAAKGAKVGEKGMEV
jgi:hypothetical protein